MQREEPDATTPAPFVSCLFPAIINMSLAASNRGTNVQVDLVYFYIHLMTETWSATRSQKQGQRGCVHQRGARLFDNCEM